MATVVLGTPFKQCGVTLQGGHRAIVLLGGHGFGVDPLHPPPSLLCGVSFRLAGEGNHGGGVVEAAGIAGRVVAVAGWAVGGIVVVLVGHGVSLGGRLASRAGCGGYQSG